MFRAKKREIWDSFNTLRGRHLRHNLEAPRFLLNYNYELIASWQLTENDQICLDF